VTYVYDDVTYVVTPISGATRVSVSACLDDVTYVYDDVTYVVTPISGATRFSVSACLACRDHWACLNVYV
jgi:hypothetical protein